jgi:hypothetical protein
LGFYVVTSEKFPNKLETPLVLKADSHNNEKRVTPDTGFGILGTFVLYIWAVVCKRLYMTIK